MRVLVVARYKERGYAPFIAEQVASLQKTGVECRMFPVRSKGAKAYLRHLPALRKAIGEFSPDVIHAHYGLCGLLANLQRKVPVVTTYHGSDINEVPALRLSRVAMLLSAYNVFVSQRLIDIAKPKRNYALIPCGVNPEDYPQMGEAEARRQMGLSQDGTYILFAGAFDEPVKNATLARSAASMIAGAELLELKGYSRGQVACLLRAVDVLLMTSLSEGSPQVIKEALVCGCPIVSVDVGDVRERIRGIEGCVIAAAGTDALAGELKAGLKYSPTAFRTKASPHD